jgi:hypothetical protein
MASSPSHAGRDAFQTRSWPFFAQLPKNLQSRVQPEGLLRRHQGDAFDQGLRVDLSVEGICVVNRDVKKRAGMLRTVGQPAQLQVRDSLDEFFSGEDELSALRGQELEAGMANA